MLYRNKLSDRAATMIVLETSRSLGLEADTPLKRIHLDLATVKQKTLVDFVTKGSRDLFMMLSMLDGFLLEDLEIWSSRKDYKAAETIAKTQAFIHYGDLYSASSRLLLRSAPDPCTAKKTSFEAGVECVRKNPGEQSLRQRKPIPHRGANHRECTGLGCGGMSKRKSQMTMQSEVLP